MSNESLTSEQSLAANGKSFHWARRFLGARMGNDAARLYAFCRLLDDMADGDIENGPARLRAIRDDLAAGRPGDDPALLHTAGDALVFELSPSQADEQSGTAGALRLVIAPYRAAPVVVLARAPRSDAGRRIDTPVALARLTQSRILDQAQVRMRQGPDGYHVVVAIPQENLGLRLRAGRYTGDFGVVYGAAEPGSVSLRMHWANRDTGLVSDVALQDRLDPQQWGRFEVLPAAEAP